MEAKMLILFAAAFCISSAENVSLNLHFYNHADKIDVLQRITEKLYPKHGCQILNTITMDGEKHDVDFYQLKLEVLKSFYKDGAFFIRSNDGHGIKNIGFKRHCNIFIIDSVSTFEKFYHKVHADTFRLYGLYIFVTVERSKQNFEHLFAIMWKKKIFNIYVIYEERNSINLATFFPFKDNEPCGNTKFTILNKYVNRNFEKELKFPGKISNFHGCPLRVTTFNSDIAVIKETLKDGSIIIHGHEIKIIETLAEKLNFTVALNFRDGFEQWGEVFENGTGTKALGELINNQTDIVIGDFFVKPVRMKSLDISDVYLNYPVILVTLKGEKLTSMEKLLQPFQPIVWVILLITFSIGLLVISIINCKYKQLKSFVYGADNRRPVMNMLIVIFGSQQPKLPKRNFARFILMMFIILCLVMRSIYQGSLYKFLQSDGRHKEPQSIQEMNDKKFTFLIYESNNDVIKENPGTFKLIKFLHGNEIHFPLEEKSVLFSSRAMLIDYSRTHKSFPFKICNENLMTVSIAFYFQKNFYIRKELNMKIRSMVSAGLIEHWISKYDNTRYWNFPVTHGPKVLRLDHLIGSFYLLGFGYFCATTVFLVEIFINKCLKVKHLPTMIH